MEGKFYNSLYNGDSAVGIMLSMGITGGDFWTRNSGGQLLYKGVDIESINFDRPAAIANINEKQISAKTNTQTSLFVLRRVNCCGEEEKTMRAAARLILDDSGAQAEEGAEKIFTLTTKQIQSDKVMLKWFYWPKIRQKQVVEFRIYYYSATGEIDYTNPLGTVKYAGRKFYRFTTPPLEKDDYRFCIRAIDDGQFQGDSLDYIKIQLNKNIPDSIQNLQANTL
ncbi:MAG: hypothetical protein K8R02_02790 [Anaerohalosphaeraceae bacterium]|nr:hypothetical protein [Anaerohalosphaeraceae bacterium]